MSKTMINLDQIDAILNKHAPTQQDGDVDEPLPVSGATWYMSDKLSIQEQMIKEFENMPTIVDVDMGSKVQEEWDTEVMARRNMLTVISGKGVE